MLKRLSLFMVLVLAVCFCTVNVSASGETYEYYFAQLTADEQEVYEILEDSALSDGIAEFVYDVDVQISEESQLKEYIDANCAPNIKNALSALMVDHPEYFWLSDFRYGAEVRGRELTVIVTLGTIEDMNILDLLDNAIQSIGATGSDYEKVKTIHEYLCNNIEYTYGDNAHTVVGALLEGKSVCEGYAESFKLACDYYGIECVCVEGLAYTNTGDTEPHMWNYVKIDGAWYALDATWDDQTSGIFMDFFLVGANTVAEHFDGMTFSESHLPDRYLCGFANMEFAYPALSSSAYVHATPTPEVTPTPTATPTITPVPTNNGWVQENGKWYYYINGEKFKNDWMLDSVGWCYLTEDGSMATNKWIQDSQGWCYVGSDGYCLTDTWMADSVGWCYLNSEGRMATNTWILDSVGWCYVGSDGYCVTDTWMADSVGWVYLDAEGRMATNRWVMDSVGWCYVGSDGYAVTNCWKSDSKGWCYLDAEGRMVVNDYVYDSNGKCWLDANGYWDGIYR